MSINERGIDARFEVVHDGTTSDTLLTGFSEFGLAGLTAADYLVNQLSLEQTGHIDVEGLPTITPFENGRPRHHTRLFSRSDLDFTVLVGELFVPLGAADTLASAVLDWTEANAVREIAVLSGVPVPHGPGEHRTFYIATEDYPDERLEGVDAVPMGSGFLAGVNGALVARGLDPSLAVCVFTTPVHARTPDADAALRLLDAVARTYDLDVDTGPLESFADQVSQHYERLAEHVEQTQEDQRYEDRMFM